MKIKKEILFVFGGERAQGAEIVIERLMHYCIDEFTIHLIMSPGSFVDQLILTKKPYTINQFKGLKKLNRTSTNTFKFYFTALSNYISVSLFTYRYIKKHQIKVVHANTIVPASYLCPLIILARVFMRDIKWYWSDHDSKNFAIVEQIQSKICVALYHLTLVVSEAFKKKYPSSKKVRVLYNGLETEIFKPFAEKRIDFRHKLKFNDELVIGIAASITPDKGQLMLIHTFEKLQNDFKNIKLLVAGGFATDTPIYSEEVKLAMHANEDITYLGYVDDMIKFYNGCDIIVNNSNEQRSESLGTTIYEAMACEKIVIAAQTGGTPEIIDNQKDGFLFKADSKVDLYAKLYYVISNFKSLENIRLAARKKVIKKFNIEIMALSYQNLILNEI